LLYLFSVKAAVQLTSYTDYSLRVLMYLAVSRRPLATIEAIAGAYGISHAHLTKVVQQLSALGLVETVRGRRGGLRLARPPERVNVGELIRNTESLALVECFRAGGDCVITPACGLRAVLGEYHRSKIHPSPITERLARMKGEVKPGEETFERKARYLFWLN